MIVVAGAGPGNPSYLTMDVYEKIRNMDLVIAFGRISETLKEIRPDIRPVKLVSELVEELEESQAENILILASGDPNFYGVVGYLRSKGVVIDQVLPGLSSFQYLMAKLKLSWHDARLLSLHGRSMSLEDVKDHEKTVILTDKVHNPNYISRTLFDMGIRGSLIAGYDLSYASEEIIKISIGEEVKKTSPLAVVVIINEMD